MIVALRAACCLAQPCGTHGAHAVGQHALFVILCLRAAFLGGKQQAIEGGADPGLLTGIRHQVTGDLLDGEAVKALVVIEGLDDVVAIWPDIARRVAVITDRVSIAHDV